MRAHRRVGIVALWLSVAVAGCGSEPPVGDDAGADAAPVLDAGQPDAGERCEEDVDCDDGLFCNGAERCDAGLCAPGAAPSCDDGVACTRDFCSEERASCVSQVPDDDGDGYGAASCVDGAGEPLGEDCDDDDASAFPGNAEVCDDAGHDEDCDPETHGGLDADGDGVESDACCNPLPGGGTSCGEDCDDARRQINPSGTEVCDGLDDDCDGVIDDGVQVMTYADVDRDGEGDPATGMMACAGVAGRVASASDCDDTRADRRSGQPEFCDEVDNDCDGDVDELAGPVPWYLDADGDGFGTPSVVVQSCAPVSGSSLLGTDCDDTRASISPAAAELCDGLDNDCSGAPDFRIAPGDFEDDDRDGYVDIACGGPLSVDCRDEDPSAGPGEPETCDGRDNDCDDSVDENVVSFAWFRDADGDGYGTDGSGVVVTCMAVAGHVRRGGDCDDGTPARSPAAPEVCSGRDEDCDGAVDEAPASDVCVDALGQDLACSAGMCRPVACLAGRGDCDRRADTGCEVTLATDAAHCGGCGIACPSAPGASGSCVAGSCAPIACASGRLDCDGDLGVAGGNGCEVAGATCPSIVRAFSWGTTGANDPAFGQHVEVAVLADGRSYVAATYTTSNRAGMTSHSAPGLGTVLLHFDASLRLVWSRNLRAAGTGDVGVMRLVADDATGDVVLAGTGLGDNALFDGAMVGPLGSGAAFVVRVQSSGSMAWGRTFPGDTFASASGLARDGAGDVVVTGHIEGSAMFGATHLIAAGPQPDGYVARLAWSDGAVLAAFRFGTADGGERPQAIAVLPGGDYVLAGWFEASDADLAGVPLSWGGSDDAFWARMTPAGAGVHAGRATSAEVERFLDVRVGPSGDYYVSGQYDGSTSVDGTALSGSTTGAMLARVSATDGSAVWALGQSSGGNAPYGGMRRLVVDASEVVRGVIPTSSEATTSFGGVALSGTAGTDTFVAVVTGAGTVTRIVPLLSPAEDLRVVAIASGGGRTLGAGYFTGSSTFGGAALTTAGASDQVVVRFGAL